MTGDGTGADPGAVAAAAEVLGPLAQLGAPLGARTTYRVGGPASLLVVAGGITDLAAVAVARRVSGLDLLVVGRGSNLLVADRGFPGIALVLAPAESAFGWVESDGCVLRSGAAVSLPTLARRSVEVGLTGFEWAVGVPGSLGGGVRMNAGGHGSDMAHSVSTVTVADLGAEPTRDGRPALSEWGPDELRYGYRRSAVGPAHIVIAGTLHLARGEAAAGREIIRAIVRWRREHQPGGQNAGSVFTNPAGPEPRRSAASLIEAAGLKGVRHGTAEVSRKHANFIQADPGGRANDVRALAATVCEVVAERFGVVLTSEIRHVGFPSDSRPAVED